MNYCPKCGYNPKYRKCPDCKGSGDVTNNFAHGMTCSTCKGKGRVKKKDFRWAKTEAAKYRR